MRFSVPSYDIANGAGVLVKMVRQSECGPDNGAPPVLLLAPPPITTLTGFADMFDGAAPKSQKFAEQYARVAVEQGCAFFDTGTVIASSELDGIHFEAGEHAKLGRAVAGEVRKLLG
jgi:lysophospholipase L1-like esterase